jgi:hypothetical protein
MPTWHFERSGMFLRSECESHPKLGHPALVPKPDPTTRPTTGPTIGPTTGPRTGPVSGVKQIASNSSKCTMGTTFGSSFRHRIWTLCLVFPPTPHHKKKRDLQVTCVQNIMQHNKKFRHLVFSTTPSPPVPSPWHAFLR